MGDTKIRGGTTSHDDTTMTEQVPASLEATVKDDLRPVRRLASPLRRALWLVPLLFLTLVAASSIFTLRDDAGLLGWMMTWGTSAAQAAFALSLIVLAFHDAIPGRTVAGTAVVVVAGAVLGFSLALTLRTWSISPTMIVPHMVGWVGRICFTGTVLSALPVLVVAAVLASRAFVVRPWSCGALYGLGAGLGADAGWRLFCHYSDPVHVFPTHTGGVLATMVVGMVLAQLLARRRSGRS